MANTLIRDEAKKNGVKLWMVAEKLGINDGNLSRKLRRELPETDRAQILEIITDLAKERENAAENEND